MEATTTTKTKLLKGHTYRVTFTKTGTVQAWESATSTHTVTVGNETNEPRATQAWINRWTRYGLNTAEVVEVEDA